MAQDEIEALADLASAGMPLQNQLGPLQQERGFGRVFLGGQLLQSSIEVFRYPQIHSHTPMVPKRYQWKQMKRFLDPDGRGAEQVGSA